MFNLAQLIQYAVIGSLGLGTVLSPSSSVVLNLPTNIVGTSTNDNTIRTLGNLSNTKFNDTRQSGAENFNSTIHSLRKDHKRVLLNNAPFNIFLADTDALRTQGLSGTSNIAENETMLFVFDTPGKYGFWMKDMLYSIDMVWLDQNGKVIYIVPNATPESFPEVFRPSTDSIAVLELAKGVAEKVGLKIGDQVLFTDR